MDTDSFIVYIKTDDIYKDIAEEVELIFDTSNYELDRPLCPPPHCQKEKIIKSELVNWINERLTRWKNHDKICWIKSQNL